MLRTGFIAMTNSILCDLNVLGDFTSFFSNDFFVRLLGCWCVVMLLLV